MEPMIGHNSGGTLTEQLAVENEKLLGEIDAFAKQCDGLPKEVTSAGDLEACTKAVKDVRALATKVESERESRKKPFLQAGRDVDAFFAQSTLRLTNIKQVMERRMKAYLDAQAEKRRLEQMEAARIAAEEQKRLLDQAEKAQAGQQDMKAEVLLGRAMVAEVEERAATAAAEGPSAYLSRTKTTAGTASVSDVWTFEIEDLAKIDLNQLRGQISEVDIRRAISAFVRLGGRQLAGVKIFQTTKVNVR